MIGYRALRGMFEGRLREAQERNESFGSGRLSALREFHDTLGMETHPRSGMPMIPRDERGLPYLKPNRAKVSEVSLRLLADAIHGHEVVEELYHPSSGMDFGSRNLMEAAIDPTSFININVFNAATAGLVFAEVMERFNKPEYIGRDLVTIKPTKRNGDKLIAVARMAPQTAAAKGRQPGEAHGEVGFGEAYQTTPVTVEQALKCKVTRESVYYDLTDQVNDEAGLVGDELGYGQEKDIADCVMGVTSGYNRNGTSSGTYQTASPWINDHSNPFSSEVDVDDARQLFVGMTDPESGREIVVKAFHILCMPGRELKFRQGLFGSNVEVGTENTAGNFPARYTQAPIMIGQVAGGTLKVQALSAIWYNRATAADGLNLSASNAKEYWWIGDYGKAFEWRENWPITPWQASADELAMKDHGIVAVYGANYRGVAYPREPRYSVRNKN